MDNARQIISVPIYSSNDKYDIGVDSLSNYPRAVIQLINKNDPNGFSQAVSPLSNADHNINRTLINWNS